MYGLISVPIRVGLTFSQELIISIFVFSPIHHDWQDLKVKMIKNKVSDGEPYNYSNKKGRQPVGMWVKPMEEQTDESVVFAKAQSLTDDSRTEIEFAVPRRKWSSLKI